MSVSKSDEKLLILASLLSPTEIILLEKYYIKHSTPCFITRWNMHLEVRQKYSAACRIFHSLLSLHASHAWYIT